MDAQTQEKLHAIEVACDAGIFREPEAKSMRILLQLVRGLSDELHAATEKSFWQENKLAKYENVVEAVKEWRKAINDEYGNMALERHPTVQKIYDAIDALEN